MNERIYFKDKNILITGAAGLLGPHLINRLLEEDANVIALVRDCVSSSLFFSEGMSNRVTLVCGDLLDQPFLLRILNEFDIEIVFHLGAQAIVGYANRSPISTFTSNIQGTWNVLEACRLSPWVKKIIVASSDKAYGDQVQLPYTEETPLQGKHPYDVSKSCADLLAQSYFHTYKLPVCITRCGNFFGGGDLHFNRIIPGTIKALIHENHPVIRSNGLFVRDYIYVKDVADAYLALAKNMDRSDVVGQAFNFSTDEPYTVLSIVDLIQGLMGKEHMQPIIRNEATNEIQAQHLDSKKARTMLNWKPSYGVKKGLCETIDWYLNYFKDQAKNYEKNFNHYSLL